MTARVSAAVLLVALGTATAVAVSGAHADDPGQPVTVVVETMTVQARVEGLDVHAWHARAVLNRRVRNRQRRELAGLRRANRARLELGPDGLTRAFLCIHSFEGDWKAHTGNGYYGGVQADRDFMLTYGGAFYRAWGTADHWPPFIQIAVAETAYLSGRGFGPWPNTARDCGLL